MKQNSTLIQTSVFKYTKFLFALCFLWNFQFERQKTFADIVMYYVFTCLNWVFFRKTELFQRMTPIEFFYVQFTFEFELSLTLDSFSFMNMRLSFHLKLFILLISKIKIPERSQQINPTTKNHANYTLAQSPLKYRKLHFNRLQQNSIFCTQTSRLEQ